MLPVLFGLIAAACAPSPPGGDTVAADPGGAPMSRAQPTSSLQQPTAGPAAVEVALRTTATSGQAVGTRLGLTHTQYSADSWGDPTAVALARSAIPTLASFQNQHLYGWGTLNPNDRPGHYDWRTLDARVELMRATGGTPVITLCCAPDWMKGAPPGTTDWSRLEVAPLRAHFDDFAELARRVAFRYPDVRHFLVWNEMKGFWNAQLNRWDHEAYTDLYNRVYRALKSVDPRIKVGGPYVVVGSWADATRASHPSGLRGPWGVADRRDLDAIEYWLTHADGADFIAIDAWTGTRDRGVHLDPFLATQKLRDIGRWLRTRTSLPIWWSEWYSTPQYPQPYTGGWTEQRVAALTVRSLIELSAGGSSVALHWAPQPETSLCGACLWSDTRVSTGGRLSATGRAVQLFHQHLAGRPYDVLTHDAPGLTAARTSTHVLLVNELGRPRTVGIDGRVVVIPEHGVVAQRL